VSPQNLPEDFIAAYIAYASESSEVPITFHRWAVLSGIGAMLGRQYYFNHGHFTIYPNMYCMLMGSPGTRKSTAIKLLKKVIVQAGYRTVAASKTTKEKFLMDLAGQKDAPDAVEELLESNIFGDGTLSSGAAAEMYVLADEFNVFFGNNNLEFVELLGTLWDHTGIFESRIKNGKDVRVNDPTINILGGNTATGLAQAFPPEAIGQGFFSRLLFIFSDPTHKIITFPESPPAAATEYIVSAFQQIKLASAGAAVFERDARHLMEKIYALSKQTPAIPDVRFSYYSTRRLTHLIKLSLIVSAARYSSSISAHDVLYANTLLAHAERSMPKALGEFGKGRNSDVSHKILQLAETTHEVLDFKTIWAAVSNDLDKLSDLGVILQNLVAAGKLQPVPGGKGFLPLKKVIEYTDTSIFDPSLLTAEERNMVL